MRGSRAKQIRRFVKQISNGNEALVEGKVIQRPIIRDGKFVMKDGKPAISVTMVREYSKGSFKRLLKAAKRGWKATRTEQGMIKSAIETLQPLNDKP